MKFFWYAIILFFLACSYKGNSQQNNAINLLDCMDCNLTNGLTDPWELKSKDQTQFVYKIANDCFFFYFKVKDSTLTVSKFTKELSVAQGDRVELFFAPDKELSEYYCLEISPKGDVLDYRAKYYRRFNEAWDFKSLKSETEITDNGYVVAGSISMKELKRLGLTEEIYLGVFRADYQGKDKVNWFAKTIPVSKEPDFHIPSAFEKI